MNDEEFGLLDAIEEDHWWFVGKRTILHALLGDEPGGRRMIDLGCGTGGVLRDWMDRCQCVGVDRSELALRICRRRGLDAVARGDLGALPIRDAAFDWMVLMDVLEHVEDDEGLLRDAARACCPGARVIVSVPAFQWMWSVHDETFQHLRRYSSRTLEAVVRSAGLVPERITFTNFCVFPLAATWRVLSYRLGLGRFAPKHDFWPIPAWLNWLLVQAYALEGWLLRRVDLPVGVSVVCVARVPAGSSDPGSSSGVRVS